MKFNQNRDRNVLIIPHWRRSLLRQVISADAAEVLNWHQVTPMTKKNAKMQFETSIPTVEVDGLVDRMNFILQGRRNITAFFADRGHPICPTSHYEDWIQNTQTRNHVTASILSCMGVHVTEELHTNLVVIHQDKGIDETCTNYQDIDTKLQNSQFKYMLESHYNSISSLYSALKKTDELEKPRLEHVQTSGEIYPQGGHLDDDLAYPPMLMARHQVSKRYHRSDTDFPTETDHSSSHKEPHQSHMGRLADFMGMGSSSHKESSHKHGHHHASLLQTGAGMNMGAEALALTPEEAFQPLPDDEINMLSKTEHDVFTHKNIIDDDDADYDAQHMSLKRGPANPVIAHPSQAFRQLFARDEDQNDDDDIDQDDSPGNKMFLASLRKRGRNSPKPENVLRQALKLAHERGLKEGRDAARREYLHFFLTSNFLT